MKLSLFLFVSLSVSSCLGLLEASKNEEFINQNEEESTLPEVMEATKELLKTPVQTEAEENKHTVVEVTVSVETKPTVAEERVAEENKPTVVEETVAEEKKPTVVEETVAEEKKPTVVEETVAEENKPTIAEETVAEEKKPTVVEETVAEERNNVALKSSEVCLTKGCVKAASAMIERMDDTSDPCKDFFQFSCGEFVKKTIIPDEKSSVTMFSEVQDELNKKMRILIEAPVTTNDSSSTLMAKSLYRSCMNTTRIEAMGLEPVREILAKMGGWPVVEGNTWRDESNFSWIEAIYRNRRIGYSIDYFFDLSVTTDVKNSSWRMIWFDQPGLGMSREYLMRGLEDKDVKAYLKYSVDVAVLLGADPVEAQAQMKEQLLFQIKVANITLPREKRRNTTKLYNLYTIKELQGLVPEIPWLIYVNTLLPPAPEIFEDEVVGVSDITYFTNMVKILAETPNRVLANFLMWRITGASISYLNDEVRDIQLEYSKSLSGSSVRPPRWKECMGLVSGRLSYAIANLYTKNYFNENAKAQAEELVRYTMDEFDTILRNVDWMDEVTREAALAKAATIKPYIAYPPELLIDEKLEEYYKKIVINDGILLDNMIRIGIFGSNYSFGRLREKVDKLDWKRHGSIAVVNAYYSSIENSIQFPAGILQGVFFEPDRPKYMNFGGIGFIIGHEITHGFDDQGKQFDSEGNLKNWWKKGTEQNFLKKAKCIIHQYGNYTAPENGMKVNGINTQGENIADNGGIKEAYYAYLKWVKNNGNELALPGMNYSPKQLFWLSAAQVWCSVYRPQSLKIRILTGVHSPGRFRVNGPLSNSIEFSKDWKCKSGSSMNPVKKCAVW